MKKIFPLLLISILFSCQQEEATAQVPEVKELIHSDFDISYEELMTTLVNLSAQSQKLISEKPQVFLENIKQALTTLPDDAWVLVDKEHALPEDHVPAILRNLDEYSDLKKRKDDMQLSGFALPSLLAMSETADQQGIELLVSSTYRSYSYQDYTYNWCVENYGQEEADRISAFPGKSQHQLGNTVDFGSISEEFEFTEAGQWLLNHAWEFGWSLSYPKGSESITGYKYEVWHYRYISPVGTRMQRDYFENMQQYFLTYWNDYKDYFAATLINQENASP
ncbi:MAG: M15 family metallopeptidase [Spirochaetaceae bacterium]|jgi:D-alanyl-D-alanine carboxypeptidase|nr:M15 family metallopeptidase [Spirochaetaceae bacterium]